MRGITHGGSTGSKKGRKDRIKFTMRERREKVGYYRPKKGGFQIKL